MRPTVKICGLRRAADVRMCARHGADILGFVVEYPKPVPWNLSADEARALLPAALPAETCIVVGGAAERVVALAAALRPDYVQYHWETSTAQIKFLAAELAALGVKLIQAIFPHTPNLEQAALDFASAGAHALLLDSRTPAQARRSAEINFAAWNKIQSAACPVMLAGGITPENAAALVARTGADMIDLMTGVESAPGLKDKEKVAALFRALQRHEGMP